MGIDLKLIPAKRSAIPNKNTFHSGTILPLTRCHDLWLLIDELPSELATPLFTPLGSGTIVDGDDRLSGLDDEDLEEGELPPDLRRVTHNVFDDLLRSVAASDLVALHSHEEVKSSFQNKAAWAYLAELPGDTRIVLYWH